MAYQAPTQNPGYNPQGNNPYQAGWNVPGAQGQPGPQPNFSANLGSSPHYAEGGVPKSEMGFSDRTIRAAFVRKVFFMVTIMLAVVAAMSVFPFLHEPTQTFIKHSPALYFISFGTFLVVYIALMCCESVRRSFPANIICTAILTLSIGYMTMMLCAFKDIKMVALCLMITTLVCGSIIIFSMQTKYDLTSMMGYVFIFSMVVMMFGFVAMFANIFIRGISILHLIYSGLAALLFMVYLAIDIQMIMGGRQYEISPEDHIFAAIQVFLDIVYIFWMLLQLLGNNN